eukprot:CAMPEP_0202818176 /NCGR_PEP_ID=MMETSP1389-20130828/8144_1 /ASSEMBLY_ACC=CAM_ASM_000865 /TAXON_ID=302021 /ORGANISM="Rhodomonas sp., Strain CCMP768" /LENGTH=143 /DNA_ID=CAMNT_0049490491 /DNA_START=212 /DNA_END=644 /DNA_ORIENTATION=-
MTLLLAVVAVGVRAGTVAVVDEAERRVVQVASAVAGALAVELASTEVDVGGTVAVHPALRFEAVGARVAHVGARGGDDLGDDLGGFEEGEHLEREEDGDSEQEIERGSVDDSTKLRTTGGVRQLAPDPDPTAMQTAKFNTPNP